MAGGDGVSSRLSRSSTAGRAACSSCQSERMSVRLTAWVVMPSACATARCCPRTPGTSRSTTRHSASVRSEHTRYSRRVSPEAMSATARLCADTAIPRAGAPVRAASTASRENSRASPVQSFVLTVPSAPANRGMRSSPTPMPTQKPLSRAAMSAACSASLAQSKAP